MDLFEELEDSLLGGLAKLSENSRQRLVKFAPRVSNLVLGKFLHYLRVADIPREQSVFLTDDNELELMWREQPNNTAIVIAFGEENIEFYDEKNNIEWRA